MPQGDAADAMGCASHRTDIRFVEADGIAVARSKQDIMMTACELDIDEVFIIIQVNGNKACRRAVLNSLTLVFFMTPLLVAIKRNLFSSSLIPVLTAIIAVIFSFSTRGRRFRIKVPLPDGPLLEFHSLSDDRHVLGS